MKTLAYILALIICILSIKPSGEVFLAGSSPDAICCSSVACHPAEENKAPDPDEHSSNQEQSNDGMCNPFQPCGSCCFLFYVNIYPSYNSVKIRLSTEYSPIPQSSIQSKYISDFWHPPRFI